MMGQSWLARGRQQVREVGVCFARGATFADRLALSRDTFRFHLGNHFGDGPRLDGIRTYDVHVAGRHVTLHLRPRAGDFFVLHEVFAGEFYRLPAAWRANLRTVVDLGAHVGLTSLYLLESCPAARVVCVEPAPDNVELLRRNLRAFADRVEIVEAAVAAAEGVGTFQTKGWSWGRRLADRAQDGSAVRCVTVPQVMREAALDQIDLLKIDVEGVEAELFAESAPWLAAVRMIIIELHHPYSVESFRSAMDRAGFTLIDPADGRGTRMTVAISNNWLNKETN